MYKKIVSFFTLFAILIGLITPVMADGSNDFFYDQTNDKILAAIKADENNRKENHEKYLKNYYLKDGEEYDESKISYRLDMFYPKRKWTNEKVIEFMKAENKAEYIKSVPIEHWSYPLYYDGEFAGQYVYVDYSQEYDDYSSISYSIGHGGVDFFQNKQEVLNILEKNNITDYNFLCTAIMFYSYVYAIIEKDGAVYAANIFEINTPEEATNEFKKVNSEVLQKNLLTVEEVEYLTSDLDRISKEYSEKYAGVDLGEGGGVEQKETESFPYWIIGVIVGVIAIAAVTVIVIKKKKA